MSSTDDLRLAVAIAEHGSVLAASASLHIAQPSASQRLAALERRLGITLFDRRTTGARPTEAGVAYVERARQALELNVAAAEAARSAGGTVRVQVGTFVSLSVPVFRALDVILDSDVRVVERVDHGGRLVADVAGGILDGAVVALPGVLASPRNSRRIRLGSDPHVLVAPAGSDHTATSRKHPYAGHDVVLATYSSQVDDAAHRLASRGAQVRLTSTAPTALALARQRGCFAVVPRTAWLSDRHDDESVTEVRVPAAATLSLVVASRPHSALAEISTSLALELGLDE